MNNQKKNLLTEKQKLENNKILLQIQKEINELEFGKENLGKGENTNFLTKLRTYINDNLGEFKKLATVLVINGVVIGSLSMAMLYPNTKVKNNDNIKLNQIQVYKENNEKTDNDVVVKKENVETQNKKEEALYQFRFFHKSSSLFSI